MKQNKINRQLLKELDVYKDWYLDLKLKNKTILRALVSGSGGTLLDFD
jgi:hypothetical protein